MWWEEEGCAWGEGEEKKSRGGIEEEWWKKNQWKYKYFVIEKCEEKVDRNEKWEEWCHLIDQPFTFFIYIVNNNHIYNIIIFNRYKYKY